MSFLRHFLIKAKALYWFLIFYLNHPFQLLFNCTQTFHWFPKSIELAPLFSEALPIDRVKSYCVLRPWKCKTFYSYKIGRTDQSKKRDIKVIFYRLNILAFLIWGYNFSVSRSLALSNHVLPFFWVFLGSLIKYFGCGDKCKFSVWIMGRLGILAGYCAGRYRWRAADKKHQ